MSKKKRNVSKLEEKNNPLQSIFDATLILAVITASLYLLSYFYDVGFKSYYNIPSSYSEISWDTVLTLLGDNWIGIAIFAIFLTAIHYVVSKYKKGAVKVLQWTWSVPFILLQLSPYLKIPVSIQFTLLMVFLTLLFTERNIAYDWHRSFLTVSVIVSICISCYYVSVMGMYKAETESQFEIIHKKDKEYVVIDSYKKYFIVSELNKNEISNEFTYISFDEIAKDALKIENKELGDIKIRGKSNETSNFLPFFY